MAADPLRDRPRFVGSAAIVPFALEVARRSTPELDGKRAIGEQTGTGAGLTLFCAGMGTAHPDIALAARDMKPAERASCDAHGVVGVARAELGYGGLVVATRKEVGGFRNLTAHQLWLALAAETPREDAFRANAYRRWSEIDPSLPDLPIEIIVPSSSSGRFDLFATLVLDRGCQQDPLVRQIKDAGLRQRFCARMRRDGVVSHTRTDITRVEALLEGSPHRVAIADLLDYQQHRDAVRALTIDGVPPLQANFADGSYPLSHPLYLFVKLPQLEQIRGLDAYLRALLDDAAIGDGGYLLPLGLAPLPADQRAAQRKILFGS